MSVRTILVCSLSALLAIPAGAGTFERFLLPRTVSAEPGFIAATPTHVWVVPKNSTFLAKVGLDGQTQDLMGTLYFPTTELTAHQGDGNAWFASASSYGTLTPAGVGGARWIPEHNSTATRGLAVGPDDHIWLALTNDVIRFSRSATEWTVYPIATEPNAITAGPDGNVWLTLAGNAIGRMTPAGSLTTFTRTEDGTGWPVDITAASDGKLWFTTGAGRVQGVSTSGSFTAAFNGGSPGGIVSGTDGRLWWHGSSATLTKWVPGAASVESTYDLGAANVGVNSISAAPDGVWWAGKATNIGRVTYAGAMEQWPFKPYGPTPYELVSAAGDLWFTAPTNNQIGRMTVAGVTTLYTLPNAESNPRGITAGPDGAVWFAEATRIGRINAAGTITEFPLPAGVEDARDITSGPDGNLWITATHDEKILRLTPAGVFTSFVVPGGTSLPDSIAAGPDGNLWFTQGWSNQIGRITPAGAITEFDSGGSTPSPIVAAGGQLWYHANGITYRMSTSGQRSAVSSPVYEMQQMIAGADGAVWGHAPGKITRIALDGTVHHFNVEWFGGAIANGPDGAVWLSDDLRQALFRMVADAPVTGSANALCVPANGMVQGVIASFVDPDEGRPASDYSATIAWGDTVETFGVVTETAPGHFDVSGSHTYGSTGTNTVTVRLTALPADDRLGGTYSASTTASAPALVAGSVDFPSAGGSANVQVNGVAGCGWTATKNLSASWITFPNGSSGMGTSALHYAVQANETFSARYGTITVGGQTLNVTQSAAGGTGLYLVTPCRLYDSRDSGSQIGSGAEWQISTVGSCGLPLDTKALVANITVVAPAQDGWLAVYRNGTTWPGVSTLNYRPGRTRANNAVIPMVDAAFLIRNGGIAPVDFIVDVTGYFK